MYSYASLTMQLLPTLARMYAWDVDNRLVQVDCATNPIRLYYGPDGDMVRKGTPRGSTFYVSAYYEVFHGTTSTNTTVYYAFNGGRAAMRTGGAVYWLHGDHLGSASLTTNITGAAVSEMRYYPFGETRWVSGTLPTDRLFTGQRAENAALLGSLMDYGARMYAPVLGRFLSSDTLVPQPGNPHNLNRFAYTLNNPQKYIDPTGHDVLCPGKDASECSSVDDRQMTADYYYWKWLYENSQDEDFKGLVKSYYLSQLMLAATVLLEGTQDTDKIHLLQQLVVDAHKKLPYSGLYGKTVADSALWEAGMSDLMNHAPILAGLAMSRIGELTIRIIDNVTIKDLDQNVVFKGAIDLQSTVDRINAGIKDSHVRDGSVFRNKPSRDTGVRLLTVQADPN